MSYTLVPFEQLFASGPWHTCIGYTAGSRKCNNRIAQENLHAAEAIWDAIISGADTVYVERKIEDLAVRCLCKRNHQWQKDTVVKAWRREIRRSGNAKFSTQTPANGPTTTTAQHEQVIAHLKLERDAYRQRLVHETRQCQSIEALLDGTRDTLAALQAEYDGTRTRLRKAKSKTSTLELQVDVLKQGMADLEESNTHLRSELIAAESLSVSSQRGVDTQQRKQAQLSGELQQSYEANRMLQDNISTLESNLRGAHTSVMSSESRVASLEERLKTSDSSAKTACKQRSSLLSSNTKLTSELDEAKDIIQRLEGRVAGLEVDVMGSNEVSMSQQQVLDHERTARHPREKTSQTGAQGCADEDEKKGEIEVDKQKEDERLVSGQQCELM
ncbi:hypothetical protein KCU99_g4544, partial [Aureobasidium melanogenum]